MPRPTSDREVLSSLRPSGPRSDQLLKRAQSAQAIEVTGDVDLVPRVRALSLSKRLPRNATASPSPSAASMRAGQNVGSPKRPGSGHPRTTLAWTEDGAATFGRGDGPLWRRRPPALVHAAAPSPGFPVPGRSKLQGRVAIQLVKTSVPAGGGSNPGTVDFGCPGMMHRPALPRRATAQLP